MQKLCSWRSLQWQCISLRSTISEYQEEKIWIIYSIKGLCADVPQKTWLHFICWSTWLRSNRRNFEHKDEINHCWTRSGWEPSMSLFPQSFLINNPLSLFRLKDVLGQRSQCSSRKPPHANPQHTVENTILTHCCYLGPTWKFHHSCKVYKMADHCCSAAKTYQVVKWKQCLDAVRQYICV